MICDGRCLTTGDCPVHDDLVARVQAALEHLTDVPIGGWEWAVVDARAALTGATE